MIVGFTGQVPINIFMITIPYTYRIYCKSTNQYYYGVRFAEGCHPADLFVKYFTSANSVKKLLETYGKDDFTIEIRKTFDSKDNAKSWERRVNRWTMKWANYLNKHSNGNFILSAEERKAIGIKSGNKCKDEKLGFHKLEGAARKELCRRAQKKGTETSKLLNVGLYAMTTEERRKLGNRCKKNKLGFHDPEVIEKRIKISKLPWWNNGILDKKSVACPGPEWTRGRMTKGKKWYNNGVKEIMTSESMDNWTKGRLK